MNGIEALKSFFIDQSLMYIPLIQACASVFYSCGSSAACSQLCSEVCAEMMSISKTKQTDTPHSPEFRQTINESTQITAD